MRGVALGDLLVDRRLVGLGLDGEQDLVLLDLVAVAELARPEKALDPGVQLDLVYGGGAADEFGLGRDRPELGGLHQHGRRRRALLGCRRQARARRQQTRRDESRRPLTPLTHCLRPHP